jgi:hypothetical protein
VARHTGLDEATIRAGNNVCWIWKGAFHPTQARVTSSRHKLRPGPVRRRPSPTLEGVGHPVRGLLGIEDRHVRVRNLCGNYACVNPAHFKARATYSVREGRMGQLPSRFSSYEEDTIGWILQDLKQGQPPSPTFYPQHLIDEANRRAGVSC